MRRPNVPRPLVSAAGRRAVDWWRSSGAADLASRLLRRAPAAVRRPLERQKLRLKVRLGETILPEAEYEAVLDAAFRRLLERRPAAELGDYLEFGVYFGTSLSVAHRVTAALGLHDVRLVGFDSFEGLPPAVAEEDAGVWSPGDLYSDLESTRAYLDARGVDWSRVVLVPGWFDDTLTERRREELALERVSVAMVDCDAYSSAKAVLPFLMPLIHDEAIVIFDDWDAYHLAERGLGERRAFEEFLADHPEYRAVELELRYGHDARVFLVTHERA